MSFSLVNTNRAWSRFRGSIVLSTGLLTIVLSSAACKSGYPVSAKNTGSEAREPRPVKIGRVAEISMEQTVTVTGTLAAYDQATVSAKVPGRMKSIAVDLGSVVRKGQIIAQIEEQEYQ